MTESRAAITDLLKRHQSGDREALDQVVTLVYGHLQKIARGQRSRGWGATTLNTTALVNEAYVRLCEEHRVDFQDRAHFFAICARAMRRILVDHARHHGATKRGSARPHLSLDAVDVGVQEQADLILAVDEALTALESFNTRLAEVVECRYFAGFSEEETARLLGTSLRTVQRDWMRARAWLLKELSP